METINVTRYVSMYFCSRANVTELFIEKGAVGSKITLREVSYEESEVIRSVVRFPA